MDRVMKRMHTFFPWYFEFREIWCSRVFSRKRPRTRYSTSLSIRLRFDHLHVVVINDLGVWQLEVSQWAANRIHTYIGRVLGYRQVT
jgi:hypothetical protein